MEKIPTLFVRDSERPQLVTREVTPGCEWALAGEGTATRKWDGTNVRVIIQGKQVTKLEKRRNPTREEKASGAEPGYVPADRDDPSDKHIYSALFGTDTDFWPDGEWPCEALGPKVQGGADGMPAILIPFSLPGWAERHSLGEVPRHYEGLSQYLSENIMEGVVFHHPDGRMAKIKRRDFGLKWPVPKD